MPPEMELTEATPQPDLPTLEEQAAEAEAEPEAEPEPEPEPEPPSDLTGLFYRLGQMEMRVRQLEEEKATLAAVAVVQQVELQQQEEIAEIQQEQIADLQQQQEETEEEVQSEASLTFWERLAGGHPRKR